MITKQKADVNSLWRLGLAIRSQRHLEEHRVKHWLLWRVLVGGEHTLSLGLSSIEALWSHEIHWHTHRWHLTTREGLLSARLLHALELLLCCHHVLLKELHWNFVVGKVGEQVQALDVTTVGQELGVLINRQLRCEQPLLIFPDKAIMLKKENEPKFKRDQLTFFEIAAI